MRSARFLLAHRHISSLLGVLLAGVLVASIAAPPASAGGPRLARPPAPQEHAQTPQFVTETNDKKWDDCTWAAAAMLIEHWTGRQVDRRALRVASGNLKGASSLADVARGTAALTGLDLRSSPNGGDPMTWSQLLGRLANGGGAVVLGPYSSMPRWYQRWDRKFAASGPKKSAHAVYVERYEPGRGRVWLMDPLGRGDYAGEWISVWALRAFVSERNGLVYAAATPKPVPYARLATVDFSQPRLAGAVVAGKPATLILPIQHDGTRPPHLATLRVTTTWTRVDASKLDGPEVAQPATAVAPVAPASAVSLSPVNSLGAGYAVPAAPIPVARAPSILLGSSKGTRLAIARWELSAMVAVPKVPGRYRLTVTLRNLDGRAISSKSVKPFAPIIVSVGGPYRARFATPPGIPFGDAQTLSIGVTNVGTVPWVLTAGPTVPGTAGVAVLIGPRLIAEWLYADGSSTTAGSAYMTLKAGASTLVPLALSTVPSDAVGLRLDLLDPRGELVSDEGGRSALIPITPMATLVQEPN